MTEDLPKEVKDKFKSDIDTEIKGLKKEKKKITKKIKKLGLVKQNIDNE